MPWNFNPIWPPGKVEICGGLVARLPCPAESAGATTVTVTVPATLAPRASVMVTAKVSAPDKLSGGV